MASFPQDWFWTIAGDNTRAWSSAAGDWVTEWEPEGTTTINSVEELVTVLKSYGMQFPATDAERLQYAITQRIRALDTEVETYIDAAIVPSTRLELRDGVLEDRVADAVREFIILCYTEFNATADAIEAVATIGEVDDPAPVWPTYGGAA